MTIGGFDACAWWWRTPTGPYELADLGLLDRQEHARLNRMKSATAAAEFVMCRATVRRVLAPLLGVEPREVVLGRRPCPGCGDARHGPPTVSHPANFWHISMSHSSGIGMLAVAERPVGVDVEAVRDTPVDTLSERVLTRLEREHVDDLPEGIARTLAFLRCWTRKEAVLKGAGIGITTDLTAVETHPSHAGPVAVTTELGGQRETWSVTRPVVPSGWTAALALRGTGHPTTTTRRWPDTSTL
ncbi:4'-phosphopantetheinyl transferase family protein [Streptomyces apocyni]|uniref:4'-phosphopantetheinyl transferase family protein n=1 Tax=Streptomyces apocyni TaxID=2654677 RepID=UPI001E2F0A23|nr:4'-phosphopantetheinyl transferase superfamily protein [Streptomyces apocyni]